MTTILLAAQNSQGIKLPNVLAFLTTGTRECNGHIHSEEGAERSTPLKS